MIYDLIVIGGGPAGMMAAGRAGELGANVLLLEKNLSLGIKLLITGKDRCNITNAICDNRLMIDKYGKNGKFLFSSFSCFNNRDVISFFESLGVKTKVERGDRVFPVSDKSSDILQAMIDYLKKSKVTVRTKSNVLKIVRNGDEIKKVVLESGEEFRAKNYLISTGGKSYPGTGSTGDGYKWLEALGHKIKKTMPALSPIIVREKIVKKLEGLSLKNVEISVYKNSKKIDSQFGEAIFTGNGMSGPIIIDMSKKIGESLSGKVEIKIDFKPTLDFGELNKRLQKDFNEMTNKMFKNSLDKILPKKLIPVIIELSKIDPEKKVNLITKEERIILIHLLKEFSLSVKELTGYSRAIVTSGGAVLSEIDPKNCKSKLINNLYIAGELLDLDGPTGGFNLQICWSTGFAVGNSILK